MGWKYRKSIKVLPGVRLNLNRKSRSITVGGKGRRTTISSTGRVTRSVGIPGTGLYHTSTLRKPGKQKTDKEPVEYSSKTYGVSGVILQVISILLFAMSLAILSFSSWGYVFALLAILLFCAGRKYRKFAIEPMTDERPDDEAQSQ